MDFMQGGMPLGGRLPKALSPLHPSVLPARGPHSRLVEYSDQAGRRGKGGSPGAALGADVAEDEALCTQVAGEGATEASADSPVVDTASHLPVAPLPPPLITPQTGVSHSDSPATTPMLILELEAEASPAPIGTPLSPSSALAPAVMLTPPARAASLASVSAPRGDGTPVTNAPAAMEEPGPTTREVAHSGASAAEPAPRRACRAPQSAAGSSLRRDVAITAGAGARASLPVLAPGPHARAIGYGRCDALSPWPEGPQGSGGGNSPSSSGDGGGSSLHRFLRPAAARAAGPRQAQSTSSWRSDGEQEEEIGWGEASTDAIDSRSEAAGTSSAHAAATEQAANSAPSFSRQEAPPTEPATRRAQTGGTSPLLATAAEPALAAAGAERAQLATEAEGMLPTARVEAALPAAGAEGSAAFVTEKALQARTAGMDEAEVAAAGGAPEPAQVETGAQHLEAAPGMPTRGRRPDSAAVLQSRIVQDSRSPGSGADWLQPREVGQALGRREGLQSQRLREGEAAARAQERRRRQPVEPPAAPGEAGGRGDNEGASMEVPPAGEVRARRRGVLEQVASSSGLQLAPGVAGSYTAAGPFRPEAERGESGDASMQMEDGRGLRKEKAAEGLAEEGQEPLDFPTSDLEDSNASDRGRGQGGSMVHDNAVESPRAKSRQHAGGPRAMGGREGTMAVGEDRAGLKDASKLMGTRPIEEIPVERRGDMGEGGHPGRAERLAVVLGEESGRAGEIEGGQEEEPNINDVAMAEVEEDWRQVNERRHQHHVMMTAQRAEEKASRVQLKAERARLKAEKAAKKASRALLKAQQAAEAARVISTPSPAKPGSGVRREQRSKVRCAAEGAGEDSAGPPAKRLKHQAAVGSAGAPTLSPPQAAGNAAQPAGPSAEPAAQTAPAKKKQKSVHKERGAVQAVPPMAVLAQIPPPRAQNPLELQGAHRVRATSLVAAVDHSQMPASPQPRSSAGGETGALDDAPGVQGAVLALCRGARLSRAKLQRTCRSLVAAVVAGRCAPSALESGITAALLALTSGHARGEGTSAPTARMPDLHAVRSWLQLALGSISDDSSSPTAASGAVTSQEMWVQVRWAAGLIESLDEALARAGHPGLQRHLHQSWLHAALGEVPDAGRRPAPAEPAEPGPSRSAGAWHGPRAWQRAPAQSAASGEGWRSAAVLGAMLRVRGERAALRTLVFDVLSEGSCRARPVAAPGTGTRAGGCGDALALDHGTLQEAAKTGLAAIAVWPAAFRCRSEGAEGCLLPMVHAVLGELAAQAPGGGEGALDEEDSSGLSGLALELRRLCGVEQATSVRPAVLRALHVLRETTAHTGIPTATAGEARAEGAEEGLGKRREALHDVGLALQLAGTWLGWQWVYSELIGGQLWALLEEESEDCGSQAPGLPRGELRTSRAHQARTVDAVAHLLGPLGSVGLAVADPAAQEAVAALRARLAELLAPNASGSGAWPLHVQATAAHSLCQLSCIPLDPREDTPATTGAADEDCLGSRRHSQKILEGWLLKASLNGNPETAFEQLVEKVRRKKGRRQLPHSYCAAHGGSLGMSLTAGRSTRDAACVAAKRSIESERYTAAEAAQVIGDGRDGGLKVHLRL
ncbi:hypothetical protein CYMTET_21338 [Cymbomonas tetramitiformis]|uniref:Uncharacterized protein n=1 Tax=Cymbomonas tetramitiformis TaxID=36881 RepID=A0AAE0G2B0_9CHLO|nr:hypothetical protein CYMTET_21338 [Cymbomonas tetramitiformis]